MEPKEEFELLSRILAIKRIIDRRHILRRIRYFLFQYLQQIIFYYCREILIIFNYLCLII